MAEAEHVAVEVKVVDGVHDHKDVGAAAEDLHIEDADLFLAFHDFGPEAVVVGSPEKDCPFVNNTTN